MGPLRRTVGLVAGFGALLLPTEAGDAQSILTFHNDAMRSGLYVMPHLTYERAAKIHLDPDFDARVEGHIYAQPLFWHFRQTSRKLVIVATEDNTVYALAPSSGKIAS